MRHRWQAVEAVAEAAAGIDFHSWRRCEPRPSRGGCGARLSAPPFPISHASLSGKRVEGGGAAGQCGRALCASNVNWSLRPPFRGGAERSF
jgi:hypothetical protein